MLFSLHSALKPRDCFDAAIWAAATCSFGGMIRVGEVTVPSRAAFDGMRRLKRSDCIVSEDLDHRPCACLRLPSAKTAKPKTCS